MKEKALFRLIGVALLTVVFPLSPVWAEEERPSGATEIDFFSKYVWPGYELGEESPVIKPSATVGYGGFSINLWGNLETGFKEKASTVTDKLALPETDLALGYDRNFGPVGMGVGYIYYGLDSAVDSRELYLSLSLNVLSAPTLTVYREFAQRPVWYLNIGLAHSFELPKGITLDFSGTVGFYGSKDHSFEGDDDLNATRKKQESFHDGVLSAAMRIPFYKYFTLAPTLSYTIPLSENVEDLFTWARFIDDLDFFYGGATLSITF